MFGEMRGGIAEEGEAQRLREIDWDPVLAHAAPGDPGRTAAGLRPSWSCAPLLRSRFYALSSDAETAHQARARIRPVP